MGAVTVSDLEARRDELLDAVERESAPLELSAYTVRGEPVAFGEATRRDFVPFHVGEAWGPPWSTTWFRVRGAVPQEWKGKRVVAVFDLGFEGRHPGFTCEALAWRDGRPWRAIDPNHRRLPIDSPEVDFYVEASAMPSAVVSGPAEAPSMLALRTAPDPAFVLRQAELRIEDEAARKVALDFKVLYELALVLPEGQRRVEILDALDRFARTNDPSNLERALARPSKSSHSITAVGHAHIDTAWLWPLRETRRKCARTFSTALALMDEYPDYRLHVGRG